MASKLKNVFQEIEDGRQYCIRQARNRGWDVRDNINFYSIGDLITEKEIPTPDTYDEWVRPPRLENPADILAELEPITYDDDTYYPRIVLAFKQDCETVGIGGKYLGISSWAKNTTTGVTNRIYIKMSDGAEYNYTQIPVDSTLLKHTFIEGTKYKYFVIYCSKDYIPSLVSNPTYTINVNCGDNNPSSVDSLNYYPLTQVYFTDVRYWVYFQYAKELLVIEDTPGCIGGFGNAYYCLCNCPKLSCVICYGMTDLSSGSNSSNSMFNDTPNLTHLHLPNLKTLYLWQYITFAGYRTHPLVVDIFNNLESLTTGSGFLSSSSSPLNSQTTTSPTVINAPKLALKSYSSSYAMNICCGTRYLSVKSIWAPSSFNMKNVQYLDFTAPSTFGSINCPCLLSFAPLVSTAMTSITSEELRFLDLSNVTFTSSNINLGTCPKCTDIVWPVSIPAQFNISGFPSIRKNSLEALIAKLPISGGTLTLDEDEYDRLTEEDLDTVAQKGWVIQIG